MRVSDNGRVPIGLQVVESNTVMAYEVNNTSGVPVLVTGCCYEGTIWALPPDLSLHSLTLTRIRLCFTRDKTLFVYDLWVLLNSTYIISIQNIDGPGLNLPSRKISMYRRKGTCQWRLMWLQRYLKTLAVNIKTRSDCWCWKESPVWNWVSTIYNYWLIALLKADVWPNLSRSKAFVSPLSLLSAFRSVSPLLDGLHPNLVKIRSKGIRNRTLDLEKLLHKPSQTNLSRPTHKDDFWPIEGLVSLRLPARLQSGIERGDGV